MLSTSWVAASDFPERRPNFHANAAGGAKQLLLTTGTDDILYLLRRTQLHGRRVAICDRQPRTRTQRGAETIQIRRTVPDLFARARIPPNPAHSQLRERVDQPRQGLPAQLQANTSTGAVDLRLADEWLAAGGSAGANPPNAWQTRPASKLCKQATRTLRDALAAAVDTIPAEKPREARGREPSPQSKCNWSSNEPRTDAGRSST